MDDTGYILSAAFIFSTAGLLSKLSHSCPLLQLQRRTSLHHCKHKAAHHGAMACSHVAGASRKYDAELLCYVACTCHVWLTRGLWGSVASVTRSKRPRAGSSHGMSLINALSSFPLSEPSLKELHTSRAPHGLNKDMPTRCTSKPAEDLRCV